MIKFWKFLSVPIVLAVCLGLLLVPGVVPSATQILASPGGPYFVIDPDMTKVGFGEDFSVNVTVINDDLNETAGFSMYLLFDTDYVTLTDISYPALLPNGQPPDLAPGVNPDWNNTEGWGFLQYGPAAGFPNIFEGFVFATVNFTSKSLAGTSYLNLDPGAKPQETFILAPGAVPILDWSSVVNGTVEVGTTLTVNVTPAGKGDVEIGGVIPPGGYPDESSWGWGSVVTLEAVDSVPGWVFDYWSGDLSGSTNSTTITMNETAKNVTANFYGQYPEISPDPSSLTFNANVGGANPANKTLDICNGGGGILNWTANITGPNATLFSMSPMNGTNLTAGAYNSTQVAVNTTNLTEGTYYANITINSTDTEENATVPVTLNLGVPVISTTPTSLTFTTNEGENPPDQTLEVCNSGTGILDWSLTDGNTAWLSESPTSGSLTEGDCEDVTVSVDASGMAAGDYSATITITGSPVLEVLVSLHIVSAMPEILVGPAQLSASALSISPQQVQPGQALTISISVANTGGETGSYNAILYINGVVEDSQSVSVAAGTSKNVIFTVSKSAAGVYNVLLAGQSGQFEVVSTGWFAGGLGTGGIIAIVVVVIVLVVAVVFILRGTRREV